MELKRKVNIVLMSLLLLLVPVAVGMAQGSGGHKSKPKTIKLVDKKTKSTKPKRRAKTTPQAVDLGLPSGVKWATCNVGASSPEDGGDYFAWGETRPKSDYTKDNSETSDIYMKDISGDPNYDVASANWSNLWRIPTKEEYQELIDNCEWKRTFYKGKYGYKVIGPNGNSIFLPGISCTTQQSFEEKYLGPLGYYWSSTPSDDEYDYETEILHFAYGIQLCQSNLRWIGQSVRPVLK